jgi:hypothetical protein
MKLQRSSPILSSFLALRNNKHTQTTRLAVRSFSTTMDNRAKLLPAARVSNNRQDVWYVWCFLELPVIPHVSAWLDSISILT